ncbi:hypothetical protein HT136_00580 [Novosphingobium profundi]|uniref:hypothetical protein n=1 Tax=Novosphingobium profundi TaxID=1774954 RepID=UPI001BDA7DA4|nr:hypothetical protein [Novosphingobium profundi]MBT0666863.1 hypothetical protein [Novosphingobium profundi]
MISWTTVSASTAALAFLFLAPEFARASDTASAMTAQPAGTASTETGEETEAPAATAADAPTLSARVTMPSSGPVPVDEACRAAANASNGGHPGTVVACFHGADGESQRVPHTDKDDTGTHLGDARPPDMNTLPGCLGPCITIPLGKVPEPVYYIDLASIPEAPKGSDAWKIGEGTLRAP